MKLFKIPASQEIIDLEIILSDLKDIPLTRKEQVETANLDRYAAMVGNQVSDQVSNIPIGKQVR